MNGLYDLLTGRGGGVVLALLAAAASLVSVLKVIPKRRDRQGELTIDFERPRGALLELPVGSLCQPRLRYEGKATLSLRRVRVLMEARYAKDASDLSVGINQVWYLRLQAHKQSDLLFLAAPGDWPYSWTDVTPTGEHEGQPWRSSTAQFEIAGAENAVLRSGQGLPLPIVSVVVTEKLIARGTRDALSEPVVLRIVAHADTDTGSLTARRSVPVRVPAGSVSTSVE